MSGRQDTPVVIVGLRGRDGSDTSQLGIPQDKAREMLNVDLYRSSFARKRGGSDAVFDDTSNEAFTGVVSSIFRHVPAATETDAELWAVDDASTPVVQRLDGGTNWQSAVTMKDDIAASEENVTFATFNGKLFMAFDSSQDRLHVWDGSTVRRTGLATPAAPTAANTVAGAYAATVRYYKVAYIQISGSTTLRMSELSDALTFTPSGSGTHARVTKPSAISEGETHWQLYGSADNETYELIAETAVGTTTYDDNVAPASYTGDAPPLVGTHTNWQSVKYLLTGNNQLIGAGSYESGVQRNRVWYSAFLGETNIGDDESVPQTTSQKNYIDLGEQEGAGEITGLGGPLDGRPLVFTRSQVWRLVPTGLSNPVYQTRPVFKGSGIGAIRHQTIVSAEDETGAPAVYFLSDHGPYRLGPNGPQAMVDDVQDIWDTVNLGATSVVAHGMYHPEKRQVWWWIATGESNDPDTILVFDVRKGHAQGANRIRGGWTKYTGDLASARCSTSFARTLGSSMSRDLVPYVGKSSGTVILRGDSTATTDAGTKFQAEVVLPDRHFAGLDRRCIAKPPLILGKAGSQELQVTYTPDYGRLTGRSASVAMSASGAESRTLKSVESLEWGDEASSIAITVGDSGASDNTWEIDALVVQIEPRENLGQT